jgi:hypothetical protein
VLEGEKCGNVSDLIFKFVWNSGFIYLVYFSEFGYGEMQDTFQPQKNSSLTTNGVPDGTVNGAGKCPH